MSIFKQWINKNNCCSCKETHKCLGQMFANLKDNGSYFDLSKMRDRKAIEGKFL